jgi:hypothetical protein
MVLPAVASRFPNPPHELSSRPCNVKRFSFFILLKRRNLVFDAIYTPPLAILTVIENHQSELLFTRD